jgi:hypothetical protein
MQLKAKTVTEYLDALPLERRVAIEAVRRTILDNLDRDYEEGIQYGMIGYYVPHRVFPAGYHCDPKLPLQMAGLGAQKSHLALYVIGLYCDPALTKWFQDAWKKTGKKLDMGKSCIRFKALDDVPLDVIAEMFRRLPAKRYIEIYTNALAASGRGLDGKKIASAAKKAARKVPLKAAKTAKKAAKKRA